MLLRSLDFVLHRNCACHVPREAHRLGRGDDLGIIAEAEGPAHDFARLADREDDARASTFEWVDALRRLPLAAYGGRRDDLA